MSDYRYQPLTDQWVIIAGNRESRPTDYQQAWTRNVRSCPFCFGQEEQTPAPIAIYPTDRPEGEPWNVRVVPNKYPALFARENEPTNQRGPYAGQLGFGMHEIIVESPRHVESFGQLTNSEIEFAMRAFQERIRLIDEEPRIRHISLFKNCRYDAGATIEHTHCQLVGTAIVPPEMERRSRRCAENMQKKGKTLLAEIVEFEQREKVRVIAESENFLGFCPYASRLPYEIWLAPKRNLARFSCCPESVLVECGLVLRELIRKLEDWLANPAYNFVFQFPPKLEGDGPVFPWYVELFPRMTKLAGYEWGTQCMINPIPPEVAAERLNGVAPRC